MPIFAGSWSALIFLRWRRLLTVVLEFAVWIALFTGIAAIGQSAPRSKPVLRIHTAVFDPDIGKSHSRTCNAFWDAYRSNMGGLKTVLDQHFNVSTVYHAADDIDPRELPMFEASHSYRLVYGYSTPQELLRGLGLFVGEP